MTMTVAIGIGLMSLIATAPIFGERQAQAVIRDSEGSVACVVGGKGLTEVSVAIRGPRNPSAELLARLPADRRDFSALPTRVRLLSPAVDEKSHQRRPSAIEALVDFPTIDDRRSAEPFTRVQFPESALKAGTIIVAERTVALSDKERVTVQTSCRITEADEVKWR